jgi:hypothetical protein
MSSVFARKEYAALAGVFFLFSLFLYVSVPVFLIPGNSYEFFLNTTPLPELLAIAALSLVVGIVLSMQAYCWKSGIRAAGSAGAGFAGFVSGMVSAVFTTATCAGCVSAIFSFMGFGGVLFLLEHKGEIAAATSVLVLLSLYFTSERIAGKCRECMVK